MTTIYLTLRGAHASAQTDGPITSGMVGLPVVISCDESWEGLTRTLVCRNSMGKTNLDQVYILANIGTRATVAPEVMVAHRHLYLGIEGHSADGTLVVPTVWADCGMIQPGAESNGIESQEATPEVWAQLASQIGNPEELETESKGNLVAAVNELSQEARESHDDLALAIAQALLQTKQNDDNLTAAKTELETAIGNVQNELAADISALSQETRASTEDLSQRITRAQDRANQNAANLAAARQELDAAIEDVHHQLSADIDTLEDTLNRFSTPLEPEEEDLPRVYLDGAMPTGLTQIQATMTYVSKTSTFCAYLLLCQANDTSMNLAKKSFAIQMFSDSDRTAALYKSFRDWGYSSNTYVLRSNLLDHSHARNIVSSNLWSDIMASREDYASLPAPLRESPRNGAWDGFPVKVYFNGAYQGVYTWNMGNERWNMSESNQGLLWAQSNSGGTQLQIPSNFRALWSGTSGDYWTVEIGNATNLAVSLNNLITFVMQTDNDQFRADIGNYLDLQSAMDYYLFQYIICGSNSLGKNLHLATYDGTKWFCACGDLDATFLMKSDASGFLSATTSCPSGYQETRSRLWERLVEVFAQELKDRYLQLRANALSFSNMCSRFERFTDAIGSALYQEDVELCPSIPLADSNNIYQIREAIRNRLAYCDVNIATFGQVPDSGDSGDIDYDLNPLANVTWADDVYYVGGELTSKSGEHLTSKFTLQNCLYELDYPSGLYPTLYMWDEDGNYLGQLENQLNYFTGRPGFQYAFRIYAPSSFNSDAITILPFNNTATAMESMTLKLTDLTFTTDNTGIMSDVTDRFNLESMNVASIAAKIHHSNVMITIGGTYSKPTGVDPDKLTIFSLFVNSQKLYLGSRIYGKVVADAMAYFAEQDTTIRFNG